MAVDDFVPGLPVLPEHCQTAIKLCFLAPSGYGKTTATHLLRDLFGSTNIRLAAPLYHLQDVIYSFIGKEIGDRQDGELLQFLGSKIQREMPHFLALRFFEHLVQLDLAHGPSIITNDDCRPHNYPYLKTWGFKFIFVDGQRRLRVDHCAIDPDHKLEWQINDIPYDLTLSNTGDLPQLRAAIREMMEWHFNVREMLLDTDANGM